MGFGFPVRTGDSIQMSQSELLSPQIDFSVIRRTRVLDRGETKQVDKTSKYHIRFQGQR